MPGKSLKVDFFSIARFFFILIAAGVLGMFIYAPTYLRYRGLRDENFSMARKNALLQKEISDLEYNLKAIEKDSFILEKIARDTIGVAKKDEIVIDIRN